MRGFVLSLRRLSSFLACLLLVGGCVAQTPAQIQTSSQTPADQLSALSVNRRIENQLRAQFSIPPTVEITVQDIKPSDIAGFDTLPVVMKTGARSTTLEFLLSKDKKTLAHLERFDISKDISDKIDIAGRPVLGNKDAKVTIINYDDFQCPFCARVYQTLTKDLLGLYGGKVRVIYKDYPLYSLHPWASHAAVDANCLSAQSPAAYWGFADYVHTNQDAIRGEKRPVPEQIAELDRIATDQGKKNNLDSTKLQACLKAQDDSAVKASAKEGDDLGVDSTPTMFINGEKISGAAPTQVLLPIINRALISAGEQVPYAAQLPSDSKPDAAAAKDKK
jgi:protein-disulfide isomerase